VGAIAAPRVGNRPRAMRASSRSPALVQDKMRDTAFPESRSGSWPTGVTTVRGFGVTSVEDPLPITTHTVFPIASISKTFAATALMRLVEQGKVDLRAPVRSYLADFACRTRPSAVR
jgi:CubicO group peptidase (beta-lactamase class C family)